MIIPGTGILCFQNWTINEFQVNDENVLAKFSLQMGGD
jgi:hypothetical protein